MHKFPIKLPRYFFIAFLVLFFLGGQPVEFGQEAAYFHGFYIPKPLVRIGLGLNFSDVTIRASSGMKIFEVADSYKLVADSADEVRVKGLREKLTEKFDIQIAQFGERKEAESYAEKVRNKIQNQVYVEADLETDLKSRVYAVKAGDFLTRQDALSFIKILNQAGIQDTWILREDITEQGTKMLWITVDNELKPLKETSILYFIPTSAQSFLSFNGRRYRGILILKSTRKGMVLINVLNLEDYLKGVVPQELAPDIFGEIEALKAQAVAARTYAAKNLGLYRDLGYDLDDTQKTQVYGGLSAEHPLSSRAVEETAGEVALYRGNLINALYTSTCGGKTEKSENIFEGTPLPYLVGTECIYEDRPEYVLERNSVFPPVFNGERNITREIAFLISLDVIPGRPGPEYFKEPASCEEALEWISRARELTGKKNEPVAAEPSPLNFLSLGRLLVQAFGWKDRVANLILKSEADFILQEFPKLNQSDWNLMAYLVLEEIFPQDKRIADKDRPATRSDVALALSRVVWSSRDWLRRGIFKKLTKDGAVFLEDGEEKTLRLSPAVFLLKNESEDRQPAERFTLQGGEEAAWMEQDGEVRWLEITFPPNTNVLDRSSRFYRWNQRISREEAEKKVNQYYPIGRLVDLDVLKRGESKRAIELRITGEEGQVVVRGLKIRNVLGLRDTLFIIEREYDAQGGVSHFDFSGKGWGHGVGLCQVGAFGMAQQGAGYKDILRKYYHGIRIEKIALK
jgi:stage II sporulation protein D